MIARTELIKLIYAEIEQFNNQDLSELAQSLGISAYWESELDEDNQFTLYPKDLQ